MYPRDKDPFASIAIRFILGVVIGFTLLLMGILFLFIALLASATENYETPTWAWSVPGIIFMIVGSYMIYKILKGAPTPGEYKPPIR